jgi:hypothetical protein
MFDVLRQTIVDFCPAGGSRRVAAASDACRWSSVVVDKVPALTALTPAGVSPGDVFRALNFGFVSDFVLRIS